MNPKMFLWVADDRNAAFAQELVRFYFQNKEIDFIRIDR
jgi:hypothetical protein